MCVIWGVPYLLIRVAVRDITPGTLVFLRTALGGLLLVPFALRGGGVADLRAVLRRWRPLLAFCAIEIAGPWLLLGEAEQHLSSSLTGLLIAGVPLVGVVIAAVLRSDDRGGGPVRYAGLLLGLVGVAVLLGVDVGQVHGGALVEVLFVVLGYASAPVILSRYLSDLPSIPVICVSLLVVALAYLPYAAVRPPTSAGLQAWLSVVALAVVCTALAFVVFFALIAENGPARSTVFTYVNPAVAVLLGVLVLDEPFTLGIAIGFPLILVGSVLAARRARPPRAATPEGAAATTVAG
ncbi:EamA family transporter [Jatrophihabitans fulvus]